VFRVLIDAFVHRYMDPALRPDVVAGLDARGFILGSVVAYELNVGFVPIRKKGKLPFTTVEETYELEYGSATVELHTDAVQPGDRVLLIDDLIATGGTMMAGWRLLEKLGANVTEGAAIVDLPELGGSQKLRDSGLSLFTRVGSCLRQCGVWQVHNFLQQVGQLPASGVQQHLPFVGSGFGSVTHGPLRVVVLHLPTQFGTAAVA
jgi:adenine phosphoribosyltransferase